MKGIVFALVLLMPAFVSAEYYPEPEYVVFGEAGSKQDAKDIDQLIRHFKQAWARGDAPAVANLHSSNVEWINAFGRTFRSSADLEKFLGDKLFPMFDPEISKAEMASFREISRRYIGSNVAVVNVLIDSNRGSSVGNGLRKVAVNFVLSKEGGDWKIVQEVIADLRERRQSDA